MRKMSDEELAKRCSYPHLFNIIVALTSPGALTFCTRLEYEHFRPDTARNTLFDFYEVRWQGVEWYIVSIPKDERHKAEQVAREEHMTFIEGAPSLVVKTGLKEFAVHGPNTVTLANALDHPCHKPGFNGLKDLDREIDRCEEIHYKHREWYEKHKRGLQ